MIKYSVDFFISSNSGRGAVSFLDTLYNSDAQVAYLLKGGPGSGKSTLMKKLADAAEKKSLSVEKAHCPSDPDSLDGIYIRETAVAFADATAPHALEPRYDGALELYISLSQNLDHKRLRGMRGKIAELSAETTKLREKAFSRLAAADAAQAAVFNLIADSVDIPKIRARGAALAKKYLTARSDNRPFVKNRFLSGITPDGKQVFKSTPAALMGDGAQYVSLRDSFGLSPFLLSPILEEARGRGYEVYACYCPLNPSKLEHLLIPEANACFLSEGAGESLFTLPDGAESRNIRLDAAVDRERVKKNKAKLKAVRQAADALITDACALLAGAKRVHNELEKIYASETDYTGTERLAEELIAEL